MKPLPASRLSIDFSDRDLILQFYLFASIRSTPLRLLRNDKTEVSSTEVLQDIICPPGSMAVYQGLMIIKLMRYHQTFKSFSLNNSAEVDNHLIYTMTSENLTCTVCCGSCNLQNCRIDFSYKLFVTRNPIGQNLFIRKGKLLVRVTSILFSVNPHIMD